MKHNIIFLLALFVFIILPNNSAYSKDKDTKVIVRGAVSDIFLGIPLKAKVYLLNTDSTIVDSTECIVQDNYSVFMLPVINKKHEYIVECRLQGYNPVAKP